MNVAAKKEKKGKKHKILRRLLLLASLVWLAYAIAKRQRPGPSVPAGGPDERVIVKDEDNLSGLGTIMSSLIKQLLADPEKQRLLDELLLTVAIEPLEQPETAITMTFSDGYVVIEPGIVEPDIQITCSMEVLMKMASMGSGLEALKFLVGPEGKELMGKISSGELKIQGLSAHPVGMMKFSRFLSVSGA